MGDFVRLRSPIFNTSPPVLDEAIDMGFKDFQMQHMVSPRSRDIEANISSIIKESHNSEELGDDAQAGVKNIEAVSMTWTKWGLIMAYTRYTMIFSIEDTLC